MEHNFENDTGKWAVKIIDETHCCIRFFHAPIDSGAIYHIAQLQKPIKEQLESLGLIEYNFFNKNIAVKPE